MQLHLLACLAVIGSGVAMDPWLAGVDVPAPQVKPSGKQATKIIKEGMPGWENLSTASLWGFPASMVNGGALIATVPELSLRGSPTVQWTCTTSSVAVHGCDILFFTSRCTGCDPDALSVRAQLLGEGWTPLPCHSIRFETSFNYPKYQTPMIVFHKELQVGDKVEVSFDGTVEYALFAVGAKKAAEATSWEEMCSLPKPQIWAGPTNGAGSSCGTCPAASCEAAMPIPACDGNGQCYTCGDRLQHLIDTDGLSELAASRTLARNYPVACGACAPTCQDVLDGMDVCRTGVVEAAAQLKLKDADARWEAGQQDPESCAPCDVAAPTEELSEACTKGVACDGAECHSCAEWVSFLRRDTGFNFVQATFQVAFQFPATCGVCRASCHNVWNEVACLEGECYTCGQRITFVQGNNTLSPLAARSFVSGEVPEVCMPCFINAPPTPPQYDTLVWEDDFEGSSLDAARWQNAAGFDGRGEQQYTEASATVSGGILRLTADKNGGSIMSGRVSTAGKADWTYGRFEIRAKAPKGLGTWPAVWLLPTEDTYGSWPNSGQVNIMEQVGRMPGKTFAGVHTKLQHMGRGVSACASDKATDKDNCYAKLPVDPFGDDFHTYSMIWTPDSIVCYVDSWFFNMYARPMGANSTMWPFDQKFHLLMSLAIGGWGGVDDNIFPATFEVDYIRVYQ